MDDRSKGQKVLQVSVAQAVIQLKVNCKMKIIFINALTQINYDSKLG